MIKRALAATLCLMLAFALLPNTALATSATSVYIWGRELNSTNPYYHNGPGGAQGTADNEPSDANATFAAGVLTLNNLNVQDSSFADSSITGDIITAIFANGDIEIVINGTNVVTSLGAASAAACGVYIANGSLTISGSGALDATGGRMTGNERSSDAFGIWAVNGITVNGGSVTGKGGLATNSSQGVMSGGMITVNSGSLIGVGSNADVTSYGISAGTSITVGSSGSITGSSGSITNTSYPSSGSRGLKVNSSIDIESGAQVLAKSQGEGGSQALHIEPRLPSGTEAVVGTSSSESGLVPFIPGDDLSKYKYFRTPAVNPVLQMAFEPTDSFTVGQAPANRTATVSTSLSSFNATNNFGRATMDGKVIDIGSVGSPGADGSVRNGSIVIELNKAYLDTLTVGSHTLRVDLVGVYAGQWVGTQITVLSSGGGTGAGGDAGADVPKTGDAATPALWLGLILLAGAGLAVSAVRRRKRQNG